MTYTGGSQMRRYGDVEVSTLHHERITLTCIKCGQEITDVNDDSGNLLDYLNAASAHRCPVSDTQVVDEIATLLGTTPDWNGADMLTMIAEIVSKTRPHPGDFNPDPDVYARKFAAATGRPVSLDYDARQS